MQASQRFGHIALKAFPSLLLPLLILSRKYQLNDAWFGFYFIRDSERSNEYIPIQL